MKISLTSNPLKNENKVMIIGQIIGVLMFLGVFIVFLYYQFESEDLRKKYGCALTWRDTYIKVFSFLFIFFIVYLLSPVMIDVSGSGASFYIPVLLLILLVFACGILFIYSIIQNVVDVYKKKCPGINPEKYSGKLVLSIIISSLVLVYSIQILIPLYLFGAKKNWFPRI